MPRRDKGQMRISKIDKEILMSLYRFLWLNEVHLSVLIGENREYVKGRLKQLCAGGFIKRISLKSEETACCWITRKGMRLLAVKERNVRKPVMYTYEHEKGIADLMVYLTLDGINDTNAKTDMSSFVTERDLRAEQEVRKIAKRKKNGQAIYVAVDNEHRPDGYQISPSGYTALEFERTPKSKKDIVEKNLLANRKRFEKQVWCAASETIYKTLAAIVKKHGMEEEVSLIDYVQVQEAIHAYVTSLPEVISKKAGRTRRSAASLQMPDIVSVNRLPLIRSGDIGFQIEMRHFVSSLEDKENAVDEIAEIERR